MKCSTCVYLNHGQILYSRFQHGHKSHFFLNATLLHYLVSTTGKFGFYQHEFSCTDLQFLPGVLQVLVMDGWPLSDSRVWRKVEKQQGLNCPQSKYNISCNANTSLFVQKMDKLSILSTTVVFCSMKFLVVAHNQCQATREKTLCCA